MHTSVAAQVRGRPLADRACDKPSLCIINFNGAAFLDATLGAAVELAGDFSEILLVDSGSDDESVAIASRYPGIRVIPLAENRGPAVARNVALAEARTDLAVLVDSDVVLARGCATRLVEALARDTDAAVAMPRVLYARERERIQYDGADPHFLGLMSLHHRDVPVADSSDDVREIGSVVTACFLVDRSRLDPDEPFDESFFIYFEDHDFGVRLRALGHRILSVPAARCYHGEGTPGLSIRAVGRYTPTRVFCLIRNRWQFILKNYSLRTLLLLSPVLALYEVAQLVAVLKKGWLREWWRAAVWMAGNGSTVLRKRREIQRRRTRSDGALLTDGPIPFRDELIAGSLERRGRRVLETFASWYWQKVGRLV